MVCSSSTSNTEPSCSLPNKFSSLVLSTSNAACKKLHNSHTTDCLLQFAHFFLRLFLPCFHSNSSAQFATHTHRLLLMLYGLRSLAHTRDHAQLELITLVSRRSSSNCFCFVCVFQKLEVGDSHFTSAPSCGGCVFWFRFSFLCFRSRPIFSTLRLFC